MKKLITLLISGSLTLAAAAMAQPPGEEQQPDQHAKKSKKNQTEQTQPAAGTANEAKPGKAERRAAKKAARQENAGMNANATGETNANPNATANTEPGAGSSTRMGKGGKKNRGKVNAESDTNVDAATGASPGASTNAGLSANTDVNEKGKGKGKHGRKAGNEAATASQSASVAPSESAAPSASVAASAETTTNAKVGGGGKVRGHGKGGKVLSENVVQKVKTEHANFKAQPRPDKAPTVTFNANFRLQGAERWQGPKYNVYRSYRPERHDHKWYHSHYTRVELIAGGYYYWNDGYWFPAWGYDSGNEYYAYDAPIYVGHRAEPPDKVIADVQAILQDAGYYEGEVDGLLGPLTRQALTDYQADNGLYTTAVIDEPTLESLGLS